MSHQLADQLFRQLALKRTDGLLGSFLNRPGFVLRQVRDVFQGAEPGLGDPRRGGVFVEELKNPTCGDVLGQSGQLGKNAGQQIMEAIDRLGRLLDLGLQAAGDFAQQVHDRW